MNSMQEKLGVLSDDIRKIRAHIGSLVICDSGFPVTVDEVLQAIGKGKLDEPSFHNGCWICGIWWETKGSQPEHVASMQTIYAVLTAYLDGAEKEDLITKYPHASSFITRTYEWLGPSSNLSKVQRLMMERLLIPFELWTKMPIWRTGFGVGGQELLNRVLKDVKGSDGRGAQIDAEISKLTGQPTNLTGLPHKHGPCDCHHDTFRYIENWIYNIGTGKWGIPTRKKGTERKRIGRLLFGYSLALDKWLIGKPMQFLLLDLGHTDLGFDPKNEILRVYAYLGEERTPVKKWLAACLWYNLTYNPILIDPDYKLAFGRAHKELFQNAKEKGISVREWIDSVLGKETSRGAEVRISEQIKLL